MTQDQKRSTITKMTTALIDHIRRNKKQEGFTTAKWLERYAENFIKVWGKKEASRIVSTFHDGMFMEFRVIVNKKLLVRG